MTAETPRTPPILTRLAAVMLLAAGVVHAEAPADASEEQRLFEQKCGTCHPSERIFLTALNAEQRRHVVLRMRERLEAGSNWLDDAQVEQILAYVERRSGQPEALTPTASDDPKTLFRERCKGCHELDRVYQQVRDARDDPSRWLHVVTRMQAKNGDWIKPGEAEKIVAYLNARMTPKSRP